MKKPSSQLPAAQTHQKNSQPTSDLLLKARNNIDRLLQNAQLGLRLVRPQMNAAHLAQLLERLVDVPDAQALARIVGGATLLLARLPLLGRLVVVDGRVLERAGRRRQQMLHLVWCRLRQQSLGRDQNLLWCTQSRIGSHGSFARIIALVASIYLD